ncbi:MAG: peptidyl-prolyl cis-trans isomerase [Gammaproteobacteria bacterium]|nr:peptidyl-prolyl cis-trans isomerase [Gammaproteobacteria bacterium]MBQ0838250.1 peptidyl-prolyl cis-trans isomerase [Gammaproteobacteria bacterium]
MQEAWASPAVNGGPTPIPKETQVTLNTNLGDIVIELYPTRAPITVANFVGYVNNGHYKGTVFHRVIPGFMAQGGGFTSTLRQKPGLPPILNEADNGLKNKRGTIAMARTNDPHSASTQFFINFSNNEMLDHSSKTSRGWGYTVFGKVIKGMDVVDKMATIPTRGRGPFRSDVPSETIEISGAQAQ